MHTHGIHVNEDAQLWDESEALARRLMEEESANAYRAMQEASMQMARQMAAAGIDDRWVTDARAVWMLYVGPLAALRPPPRLRPRPPAAHRSDPRRPHRLDRDGL